MTFWGGTDTSARIAWPEPVKNSELKILWGAIAASIIYLPIANLPTRSFDIAIQSVLSLALCLLIIRSAGYRLFSLSTGFALTIIVFYPLCAFLNLILPEPAVKPALWLHTRSGLQACNVGLLGFLLGQFICKLTLNTAFSSEINCRTSKPEFMPPRYLFLAMTLAIACAVILKIKLGIFYHITIAKPNPASNIFMNALETFSWIGIAGICGFLVYSTRSRHKILDVTIALGLVLAITLAYLPSGSRMQAVGYLPITALLYLAYEPRLARRLFVVFAAPLAILAFVGIIGAYRVSGADSHTSLSEKAGIMLDAVANQESYEGGLEGAKLIIHRLSDFVATGRLVDWTPRVFPFRTFEGMETWWQIYLPGALRPSGKERINFNEGTLVTLRYKVSDGPWTSTPITLFGDLYSRFGWSGLFLVMSGFGLIYRLLDELLLKRTSLFTLIVFVMYFRFLWQIYVSSFLTALVSLTRDLPLIIIIALLINMTHKTLLNRRVIND